MKKLIQGDCLKILKDISFKPNYILVSDPPFNIKYKYNSYKDNLEVNEYFKFLFNVFNGKKHILIHYPEFLYRYSVYSNIVPNKVCSWVYNSNNQRQHRDIAFYNIDPDFKQNGQEYKNPKDKRIQKLISQGKKARLYDWWNINQVKNVSKEKLNHPCQMPLQVMKNIIGTLPKDSVIVDPFMGTGTTGCACYELGLDFIGIELDKDYFEIAKKRINETQKNKEVWIEVLNGQQTLSI